MTKYSKEIHKQLMVKTDTLLNKDVSVSDIEVLKEVLRFHEYKYYVDNDALISDHTYDALFKKLQDIELAFPYLISDDSPTQRVGIDLTENFETVKHLSPMLSLDNSYNADDLIDFDNSIKKLCQLDSLEKISYSVEPKFDGGTITLVYENDILVRAATRGNGIEGDDITSNAKILPSIPLQVNFSRHKINKAELRGEAIIRKDFFEHLNAERAKQNLSQFANPRNTATGGLRTKDPYETKKRGVEVFVYQLSYAVNLDKNDMLSSLISHNDTINLLGELGFKVPKNERKLCSGIKEVIDFCNSFESEREKYPYELDGMVVKVNDYALQAKCGFTSHHPRWAIAFKFKAKQAISTLEAIEYQVGKIGSITPVAKIKPVYLAGVTVSSISLHNEEFILSKDLHIGDAVLVERAGDVIPYIVKALPELRKGNEQKIQFPLYCPENNTDIPVSLVKIDGESAWRCPHCVCGAQDLQKIIFHVSKDAMDIDGFGKALVEKLYTLGWIKDISDVYALDYEKIASLDGMGPKSAEKLKLAINQAKLNPIHKVLHSLSIHHLGKRASKLIAERISHVLDLKYWTIEDFTSIKDIGPVVAENVTLWFDKEQNVALLTRMEKYGVNLYATDDDKPIVSASEGVLAGKSILFTGTLSQMTRKEAEERAAKLGAKIMSAVSSQLDILVVGEKAGSKLTKAKTLGTVEILTEDNFISMTKNI